MHSPISANNEQLLKMLEQQGSVFTLRGGIDYHRDRLWYGMVSEGAKKQTYFICTGRQGYAEDQLPDGIQARKGLEGSPMSSEGVKRYLNGDEVSGTRLLAELEQYFANHAKFQHDTIPAVLAHWVLAGYLYMAFPIFPYIWITSAQRGSGKSRVEELLAAVAFRAGSIQVNPTPAVLYRTLDLGGQVLIIDEFEDALGENKNALTAILNSGFSRGCTVQRCSGENLEIRSFQAYGPKVFAGLDGIPDTLRSRSIKLVMVPKRKADTILPFSPVRMQQQLQEWRDDLAIWALNSAPCAEQLSNSPDQLEIPEHLDDRAVDYMTPLFATSIVAGGDKRKLVEFCYTLAEERRKDASEGDCSKIVSILRAEFNQGRTRLSLQDISQVLVANGLDRYNPTKVGELLRKLPLSVKQLRFDPHTTGKGVELAGAELEELSLVYNLPEAA